MQLTTLILSIVCILAGTGLLLAGKGEAMAAVMITAGAGGLARNAQVANKEKEAARERERDAMETTQQLRAELFKRENEKPKDQ